MARLLLPTKHLFVFIKNNLHVLIIQHEEMHFLRTFYAINIGCLYSVRYKMGNKLAIRCLNIEKKAILQSRISIRWICFFSMLVFVSYHTIL